MEQVNIVRPGLKGPGPISPTGAERCPPISLVHLGHCDGGSRVFVSRDVSERVRQAAQQAHQERLAVLGEVAAVMAHEMNNPLAAISMFNHPAPQAWHRAGPSGRRAGTGGRDDSSKDGGVVAMIVSGQTATPADRLRVLVVDDEADVRLGLLAPQKLEPVARLSGPTHPDYEPVESAPSPRTVTCVTDLCTTSCG